MNVDKRHSFVVRCRVVGVGTLVSFRPSSIPGDCPRR